MKKYYGEYSCDKKFIGCSGQNVYIYELPNYELLYKIKIPYVYSGVVIPDKSRIIVKSSAGYLASIDLASGDTIKKRVSILAQDGGFELCKWDNCFYNIEMHKDGWKVVSYDTSTLDIIRTIPINGEILMVYDVEFDDQKPHWYVSLSCRYKQSVRDVIVKMKDDCMEEMKVVHGKFLEEVSEYKGLARCGFTEKSYQIYRHEKNKGFGCKLLKELYESQ